MEVDRRFYRRAGRIAGRSDRRVVQIGDGDQLQQQVDRMAAEELQPDLRRSRHVAGHLHAPVFDRRDGQATRNDGRDDRQRRRESRDQAAGIQTGTGAEDRIADGDGGLLRAHGRLALHDGPAGQDGRRRRHHGRSSGRDGRWAFAPPLDEAGNSVKAQKALAYVAGHLNLNIFGTTRCVMAEKEPAKA